MGLAGPFHALQLHHRLSLDIRSTRKASVNRIPRHSTDIGTRR
jgi:hypothetical protein